MLDLSGKWKVLLPAENGLSETYDVTLPGTLDTNGIGNADKENLNNRLTRLYTWEGKAEFRKEIMLPEEMQGKRIFLYVERARKLSLTVNGREIPKFTGTLSTPWIFELTGVDEEGKLSVSLVCDNSYEGWPYKAISHSSAATDETQTNWNGLLGELKLTAERNNFIESIQIYPQKGNHQAKVSVTLNLAEAYTGTVTVRSAAFKENLSIEAEGLQPGQHKLETALIDLKEDAALWDEGEGNLYVVWAEADGMEEKKDTFGIRTFGKNEKNRLTINDRVFFLRGEANCAVFPETGYAPMDEASWEKILGTYASYGINCMRFHSWCPPEAAFRTADKMGMMMQPELSNWNYEDAFETDEDFAYFREELETIIKTLANHPSFVMFSFGNELWAEEPGHARMNEMLDLCHELDDTRFYANSSNPHYGMRGTDEKSDFYTSHNYKETLIRGSGAGMTGHINQSYPNARTEFGEGVRAAQAEYGHPVFGFEVGQFEILPDFTEIDKFKGVTRAVNFEIIRENARKKGFLDEWQHWVEATGENAFYAYREEVEATLRTEELSGLSLLGLQDFPGQGTALVGMLNSHLEPKPFAFAKPERFRKFFAETVLLAYLEKYTYTNMETICAPVKIANYGKTVLDGAVYWSLRNQGEEIASGSFPEGKYENQGLREVGNLEIPLENITVPSALTLELKLKEIENSYTIWVYPVKKEAEPEGIRIAEELNKETLQFLRDGGKVFLDPPADAEHFPASIGGQFTTDFWSVGSFPEQEGGMGMVIEKNHPALAQFPTEFYSQWQWWPMANGRPMILPDKIKPILTVPDSYLRMKHMGLLFEAKVGKGKLMVSSMALHAIQKYPEAAALRASILNYMETADFSPAQELTEEELMGLAAKKCE